MGILVVLAMVWWFVRLGVAVVLTVGLSWAAIRFWQRSAWIGAPAGKDRGLRYLAMTVGLAAFVPLIWVRLTPVPDFYPDLRHAPLRPGGNLTRWELTGADLRGRNLSGADLQQADLQGADLRGVVLRGADIRGAELDTAKLQGADLRGADLREARVTDADFIGARYDALTRWPDGFRPQRYGAVKVQ